MTTFDERERGFEAKFAHDQDTRFLAAARRDKLFAHWAAEKLALDETATGELTATVLHMPGGLGHEDRLLSLVGARLQDAGIIVDDQALARELRRCNQAAEDQVMRE